MEITYLEHSPAPALAALVRCYWTVSGAPDGQEAPVNRVLPDGCIDVIFDLRDGAAGVRVIGTMLEAEVIRHESVVHLMGVRFAPAAAPLFLHVVARELTSAAIDATDVWPDARTMLERLVGAASLVDRLSLLDGLLIGKLDAARPDPLAGRGMSLIERSRGLISLDRLRGALGAGERTLQRRFLDWVGITPKQAVRVARLRHAVQLLSVQPRLTLARIAVLAGYTDQAHLTREFRAMARTTPGEFARERKLVGFVQDAPLESAYLAAEPQASEELS